MLRITPIRRIDALCVDDPNVMLGHHVTDQHHVCSKPLRGQEQSLTALRKPQRIALRRSAPPHFALEQSKEGQAEQRQESKGVGAGGRGGEVRSPPRSCPPYLVNGPWVRPLAFSAHFPITRKPRRGDPRRSLRAPQMTDAYQPLWGDPHSA